MLRYVSYMNIVDVFSPLPVVLRAIIMCPVEFICPPWVLILVVFVCIVVQFISSYLLSWFAVKLYIDIVPPIPLRFLAVVIESVAAVIDVFILNV